MKGGETEMWRSRKMIIIAVLTAIILAGSISGAVLAADNGEEGPAEAKLESLMTRVGEIYQQKTGTALDLEALQESFAEAQQEMRTGALQDYLDKLVAEGKITQEEADQYFQWRQAKPDVPIGFGDRGQGSRGRFRIMGSMCPPAE